MSGPRLVVAVPVTGQGLVWMLAVSAGLGAVWFVFALIYAVVQIPDNWPTDPPATSTVITTPTTATAPPAPCYPFADCAPALPVTAGR